MEFVRFTLGLILSVILVLHVFRDSSAHADDQQGRKMKGNMVMGRKENISPAAFDSSAVVAGKQVLGGRKMVTKTDQDLSGKGLTGESPKKSENDKNASKQSLGGHQHHLNNQNGKVSESKTTDFAQKNESYRVMEGSDREVMNLMRKDYKGMNKPRRNPPINNHKPTD